MVIRVQLTIKHIRGDTFQVESNVDGDVLGLKVQIWEAKKIAIENQRLVFSGKELQDNVKLNEAGIGDNAVIFLVESIAQPPQQQQPVVVQPVTVELPQINVTPRVNNPNTYPCQYPGTVNNYQPIDNSNVREDYIQRAVDLAYWVRLYCILGMFLSGLSSFHCLFSLIPFLMYTFGYIGTRKLSRCLLFLPWLLTIFTGIVLSACAIYLLFNYFNGYEFILLFFGIAHLIIASCICRLMCRIKKLTRHEWWQARLRIQSRCCC